MAQEKKKMFWTWSAILAAAIGITIGQLVNESRQQEAVKQGLNQLRKSVQQMSAEESAEFDKTKDDMKALLISKFTPEESDRAQYLNERFAKGIAIPDEMAEWSRLLAKAKTLFTPDEAIKFKRYEKFGFKLAKVKKPDSNVI